MALFVARGLQHSWLRRRITRRFKGLCVAICNLAVSDVQFWSQTVPFGQDQYRSLPWGARIIRWAALAVGALCSSAALAQESDFLETLLKDTSNVMIVLDGSGSMNQGWGGGASKFEAARDAVTATTANMPSATRSGAITFGHRRNFDCSDIEVLTNPTATPAALARALRAEAPQERGMRPLADAIETAAARLSQQAGPGAIVVLTDGAEECGGNACALSAPLAQMQIPVHLIGMGMDASDAALLRCLPSSAGGSFVVAEPGEDLTPLIAKALSLSHTSNAQRSAASIARLLLQEQDMSVRDLTRIRGDLTRLDDAVSALAGRVNAFSERDLLTEELQIADGLSAEDEIAMIRGAAERLRDQLGSRDLMLIRMQDQTDAWNSGTLGLSRRADLAADMAKVSAVVTEPADKLRQGYERLVQRRAKLETEMAATAAQSAELHGRINDIEEALDQNVLRASSAQQLAQSLESGRPLADQEQPTLEGNDLPVLEVIARRDVQISELESERSALLEQLKSVRAELMDAQQDVLVVQRQRADAERRVNDARDLLAGLQANQLAMKANWEAEVNEAAFDHMKARQALELEMAGVLAASETMRTDLNAALEALEATKAENLRLVTARNDALTQAAESKLTATRLETQNQTLTDGLAQCRLGQEDLSQRIAMLEAAMEEAQTIVAARKPDTVRFMLSPDVPLDADVALSWTVEDAVTNASLDAGQGASLSLPKTAGEYRVIAELDGQLVEQAFSVEAFERTDHEFSLDLARLELRLDPTKATDAAIQPLMVRVSSPFYALEIPVAAGEVRRLYVPEAAYTLEAEIGLDRWSHPLTVTAGETTAHAITVETLPVSLDLIAGESGAPIDEDLQWVLRDARNPAKQVAFQGPQATIDLKPGIYDVEVAFEGFVASQTVFVDASEPVSEPIFERVRFNDGAVRLSFANNGEAVPAGIDVQWRIEMQGAAIVTSQTLDGDMVQLPAGGYQLRSRVNDVELEQEFYVLAGQVTALEPDFSLGQVTLSLLDDSGRSLDDDSIEWSIVPQQVSTDANGFGGAVKTGAAVQTLLLPEGRYRVTAQAGSQVVNRLISVKSGDKSSFGLMLKAVVQADSLAQLVTKP